MSAFPVLTGDQRTDRALARLVCVYREIAANPEPAEDATPLAGEDTPSPVALPAERERAA